MASCRRTQRGRIARAHLPTQVYRMATGKHFACRRRAELESSSRQLPFCQRFPTGKAPVADVSGVARKQHPRCLRTTRNDLFYSLIGPGSDDGIAVPRWLQWTDRQFVRPTGSLPGSRHSFLPLHEPNDSFSTFRVLHSNVCHGL